MLTESSVAVSTWNQCRSTEALSRCNTYKRYPTEVPRNSGQPHERDQILSRVGCDPARRFLRCCKVTCATTVGKVTCIGGDRGQRP